MYISDRWPAPIGNNIRIPARGNPTNLLWAELKNTLVHRFYNFLLFQVPFFKCQSYRRGRLAVSPAGRHWGNVGGRPQSLPRCRNISRTPGQGLQREKAYPNWHVLHNVHMCLDQPLPRPNLLVTYMLYSQKIPLISYRSFEVKKK